MSLNIKILFKMLQRHWNFKLWFNAIEN